MSLACCEGMDDGGAIHHNAAASVAANTLARAASPTFAVMALLSSSLGGGPADMLCSAADGARLNGMTTMYMLMSAFHAGPWLKLIRALRDPEYPILWRAEPKRRGVEASGDWNYSP